MTRTAAQRRMDGLVAACKAALDGGSAPRAARQRAAHHGAGQGRDPGPGRRPGGQRPAAALAQHPARGQARHRARLVPAAAAAPAAAGRSPAGLVTGLPARPDRRRGGRSCHGARLQAWSPGRRRGPRHRAGDRHGCRAISRPGHAGRLRGLLDRGAAGPDRARHHADRPPGPGPVLRRPDQRDPLGRRPAPGRRPRRPHRTPRPAPRAGSPRPGLPLDRVRRAGRLGHRPPHPPLEPGRRHPPGRARPCSATSTTTTSSTPSAGPSPATPTPPCYFTHPGGWLTLESPLPGR